MAPADRRKAIIDATIPLLKCHGPNVTTKQIAEAAGIAEGTIFRAFPDKETLVRNAIKAAWDPAEVIAELAQVDRAAGLEIRLVQIVQLLQARLESVFAIITKMGFPPADERKPQHHDRGDEGAAADPILTAVEGLLRPDADRFRLPVSEVVRMLRLLTFAGTHPRITDEKPMDADEVVSLLLYGTVHRSAPRAYLPHQTASHPAAHPIQPLGVTPC